MKGLFSVTFLSGIFYALFLWAGGAAFTTAAMAGLAVSWWVGLSTTIIAAIIIGIGILCELIASTSPNNKQSEKDFGFLVSALFFMVVFSPVILLLLWLSLHYPIAVGDYRALVLYGIAYLISFIQKNTVSNAKKSIDSK